MAALGKISASHNLHGSTLLYLHSGKVLYSCWGVQSLHLSGFCWLCFILWNALGYINYAAIQGWEMLLHGRLCRVFTMTKCIYRSGLSLKKQQDLNQKLLPPRQRYALCPPPQLWVLSWIWYRSRIIVLYDMTQSPIHRILLQVRVLKKRLEGIEEEHRMTLIRMKHQQNQVLKQMKDIESKISGQGSY